MTNEMQAIIKDVAMKVAKEIEHQTRIVTLLDSIKYLMEEEALSMEECMNIFQIRDDDRAELRELVN